MYRRNLLLSIPPLVLTGAVRAQEPGLTVFAAASLTDVLGDIDRLWQAAGHPHLLISFASSSTLARQIDQGAPAAVFASADEQWADWLQARGRLVPGTRQDLLTNQLVLVMPRDVAHPVAIDSHLDVAALLGATGRLAMGDPGSVPVGIYARQALTRLGLWAAIEPRLASADSVRSALLLVERGEAPAGIVYATDVAVTPSLVVAGTFPAGSHEPITYPFALVQGGDTPEARSFLAFLSSPAANAAFEHRGFGLR